MSDFGVLILNSHNISLSYSREDIDFISADYNHTLKGLERAISEDSLKARLRVKPNPPQFKIR